MFSIKSGYLPISSNFVLTQPKVTCINAEIFFQANVLFFSISTKPTRNRSAFNRSPINLFNRNISCFSFFILQTNRPCDYTRNCDDLRLVRCHFVFMFIHFMNGTSAHIHHTSHYMPMSNFLNMEHAHWTDPNIYSELCVLLFLFIVRSFGCLFFILIRLCCVAIAFFHRFSWREVVCGAVFFYDSLLGDTVFAHYPIISLINYVDSPRFFAIGRIKTEIHWHK